MAFRRLRLSDLGIGKPLQREGFSAPQPDLQQQAAAAPSSVLHTLNQINRRLEHILMDLRDASSADTDLRAMARQLIDAANRDTDIALASIFLNQIGGAYAIRHCTEAAIIAGLVAQAMGKNASEVLIVTAAALTMNVGMVRQSELFQGRDSALTDAERAIVRRHPSDSVDMLRYAGITDEQWLDLVLLHHENDDGSGYPQGRLGDEISQNARLIGLADRYCAFVSARNYRRSLLPPVALARLQGEVQTPHDPDVIARFTQLLGAYPPGTLVRLNNGETGVVSSRIDAYGTFGIHVLRGPEGAALPLAEKRSSAAPGCGVASALEEDGARLRFTMQHIWGDLASL
jgi:HD-GYP domain-containing protein (c-di-GMP phosphodiesterase class II)